MNIRHKLKRAAALFASACVVAALPAAYTPSAGAAVAAPAPVNPSDYPKLDKAQMGHVRLLVGLADQLDGDWARMGYDYTGIGFDWYRYQLAFQVYTLGVANYFYTPAYPDLYKRAMDRAIVKMLRQDTWWDWVVYSRGAKIFDPDLTELREGWADPVKKENIMYSGHLLQMINLYESMFNDKKWEAPDSIDFVYAGNLGTEHFKYNNQQLAKLIYDQFKDSNWVGISCEPNTIFTPCNTHPIVGLKLYDQIHKTNYYDQVEPGYKKAFLERQYFDPKTYKSMNFWMVRQNRKLDGGPAQFDAWTGLMQHAWDRDYINTAYEKQRDARLFRLKDGTVTMPYADGPGAANGYSGGHGFWAAYAAEVGDVATRDAMIRYADKYWSPTVVNGERSYPRSDKYYASEEAKKNNILTRVAPQTGNNLMALARLLPKDGLYTMYNKPFTAEHFNEPYLGAVRYPSVLVSQAVYDRAKEALVFSVEPGRAGQAAQTSWQIHNLTPGRAYAVWVDGKKVASLAAGGGTAKGAGVSFARQGEAATLTTSLAKPMSFVVQAS